MGIGIKDGPFGSKRHYNLRNGQYVNEAYLLLAERQNKKISKREKKRIRREALKKYLDQKAFDSPDKYLYSVYKEIQKHFPYSVLSVNEKVYMATCDKKREIDILTKTSLIEIKSGEYPHCKTQCIEQIEYCKSKKIRHYLFDPEIAYNVRRDYEKSGIKVATNINELIKMMKES